MLKKGLLMHWHGRMITTHVYHDDVIGKKPLRNKNAMSNNTSFPKLKGKLKMSHIFTNRNVSLVLRFPLHEKKIAKTNLLCRIKPRAICVTITLSRNRFRPRGKAYINLWLFVFNAKSKKTIVSKLLCFVSIALYNHLEEILEMPWRETKYAGCQSDFRSCQNVQSKSFISLLCRTRDWFFENQGKIVLEIQTE